MQAMEKLSLIDGSFDAEESKEILFSIFSNKIHFHEMKNFSSQLRFGKDNATALKRIPELKKNLEKLVQIVTEAKDSNKILKITADINIVFSENEA